MRLILNKHSYTQEDKIGTVAFRWARAKVFNCNKIWGAVDAGYVNAFLAAALTRVMRAVMPIPVVTVASVLHSAAVGGS